MAAVGKSLQVLTYGAAPKLSPVIPEGPHLPDDPWSRAARYADEALVLAKEARPDAACWHGVSSLSKQPVVLLILLAQ
eukprot:8543181-Pyramimonas_sp.AAC.1